MKGPDNLDIVMAVLYILSIIARVREDSVLYFMCSLSMWLIVIVALIHMAWEYS